MESNEWSTLKAAARAAMVRTARRGGTMTYAELLAELGRAEGLDGLGALLRQVSVEEDTAGRGLLSAVVVREAGLPGGGFFQLAEDRGRDTTDRRSCWRAEHKRVVASHQP